MTVIGVLGTQGDVAENVAASRKALGGSGEAYAVWSAGEIGRVDALVIPGGESTAIGPLSELGGALAAVRRRVDSDAMPVLGICAGLAIIARSAPDRTVGRGAEPLGLLDADVERNSFGRQRDSFEADLALPGLGIPRINGVFIRAPTVLRVGAGVEVLARLGERIVAVREGPLIGVAFHPELDGAALHRSFAGLAAAQA